MSKLQTERPSRESSPSRTGSCSTAVPGPFPRVSCILLNWNGWQDTVKCLDALDQNTYPQLNVIVVDNGSTNDSIVRIREAHPNLLLLESKTNRGFAGGNNIGIRHALAQGCDYIWLLNNDTEPAPDALSALVSKAVSDQRIGAVGSVCYYTDRPSTVQAWAGGHVNLWMGYQINSTTPRGDDWFHTLNGASLLIARAALEESGLLDEGFFLYWEDTEFCLRLRKKGWKLAAAADSRVLHKVNASTQGNDQALTRHSTTSGLRFLKLHSPTPRLSMFLFLAVRLILRLLRFDFAECRSVWTGMRDYCRLHPESLKMR